VMKLENLPGFDVEDALHRLRGNRSLYAKLLRDLADQHGRDGDQIREILLAGDFQGVRQLAHQLKGVAGNLSAIELHAAAAELEQAVATWAGDGTATRTEAEQRLARLQEVLKEVVGSIGLLAEEARPAGGGSRGEAGDAVELDAAFRAELARSIREAIEIGDVAAVECAVAKLPEGSRQRCEFQELLDAFDLTGVERLVAELERTR